MATLLIRQKPFEQQPVVRPQRPAWWRRWFEREAARVEAAAAAEDDLREARARVEALGGHGEHVERPEDLRPALERAAASGKPALINVMIKQDRDFKGGIYV